MIVWVRIAQIWTVVATDVAKAKAGTAEPGGWGAFSPPHPSNFS